MLAGLRDAWLLLGLGSLVFAAALREEAPALADLGIPLAVDLYAPRLVEYDVLADRGWLRPGDVVTITDSELAWVTVVALIVERRVSDIGVWRLTLQILDPLVSGSNTKGPGANGAPTWTPPGGN